MTKEQDDDLPKAPDPVPDHAEPSRTVGHLRGRLKKASGLGRPFRETTTLDAPKPPVTVRSDRELRS